MTEKNENRKKMVARMAKYLGCTGSHRNANGELMPCSSHDELMKISQRAEPKKKESKKRKKRDGYEPLGESGVTGIETMPGGGLVASRTGSFGGKSFVYGRALPRLGDPDVFTSPEGARERSRALGCIGIARRSTPEGVTVWMPCSNMSDYRRRTGVGVQAQRDRDAAERRLLRRLRKYK